MVASTTLTLSTTALSQCRCEADLAQVVPHLELVHLPELRGSSEKKILRSAACKWLNRPVQIDHSGQVHKNYERWSHESRVKQKLKIGGIFPKSGNKYVAPELMPGWSRMKSFTGVAFSPFLQTTWLG